MWDEPAHIAAGMEWLSRGRYTYEPQHPPLARVAAAIGPYLGGARTIGQPKIYDEGRALLGEGAHYRRMLTLARLGMLPFLWVMLAVCAAWGARAVGPTGGALAVVFAATNPNLLAHAGIAGTDLAPAALAAAALFAWMRWREESTLASRAPLRRCGRPCRGSEVLGARLSRPCPAARRGRAPVRAARRASARLALHSVAPGDRRLRRSSARAVGDLSVRRRPHRAWWHLGARAGALSRRATLPPACEWRPSRLSSRPRVAARLVVLLPRRTRREDATPAAHARHRRRRRECARRAHGALARARSPRRALAPCSSSRSCRTSTSACASC